MTKKHFEKLADVLGREKVSQQAVEMVMNMCADLNPAFDRGRFRAAVAQARMKVPVILDVQVETNKPKHPKCTMCGCEITDPGQALTQFCRYCAEG